MKFDLQIDAASRALLAGGSLMPGLVAAMQKAMYLAERETKINLSGKVLNRRTGRLRSSITTRVTSSAKTVMGEIGSNVVYARIHELGGEILPRRAKALKFFIPGAGWRTARKVTIPRRPYLRRALTENLDTIQAIFAEAIVQRGIA